MTVTVISHNLVSVKGVRGDEAEGFAALRAAVKAVYGYGDDYPLQMKHVNVGTPYAQVLADGHLFTASGQWCPRDDAWSVGVQLDDLPF